MEKRITAPEIRAMKARGEKIAALTASDYPTGRLIDEAGIDIALVGDSLGMVVLGFENTLAVTLEMMIHHAAAVARGCRRALIVGDMPFMSYQTGEDEAVRNAGRLVREGGTQAVKLEGGRRVAGLVRRLVDAGIPVMGHLGMTPQSVHQFGGYGLRGKEEAEAARILEDARILEAAGAFAVVLEVIPPDLARKVTESVHIPTIGIGAGPDCDGQVLVTHDVLGYYDRFVPRFAKKYANLWETVRDAFSRYREDVKSGKFPASQS